MSIAVLNQVYDEMRRLAIAGSNLASDDFRLKKLLPPLEKAGEKVPVFAKVAEAIQKVIDSSAKNSSQALLELSTLVTAILYTQGGTGAKGTIKNVETQDFGLPTSDASARVLKPLIEALTTTGSGRLEIIRDAHERGAFKDLRLVKLAVAAIDDVYSEIGDFIADHVLPIYGKAIYADLREPIDMKGRGGHVRRLRILNCLDPDETHELVEQALESGSKEMKVAALECLQGSKDHVSYLLEQTKAKSKDVRRAALKGISEFKDKEVVETLQKALSGADIDLAVEPVSRNASPKLLQFLLEDGQLQFDALFTTKAKAKLKTQLNRFHTFLQCFASRSDKKSEAFLMSCFQRHEDLTNLKGIAPSIIHRLGWLLVHNNSKAGQKLLVDSHESLGSDMLDLAMLAAMRTRKPKEVFDLFSPYLFTRSEPKKKKANRASRDKREIVEGIIQSIAEGFHRHYFGYHGYYRHYDDDVHIGDWAKDIKLDPQWLDAAVRLEELEMVVVLARPKHKDTIEFLSKTMDAGLKKKGNDLDYDFYRALNAMNRINHPKVVEYFLAALEKAGKAKKTGYYYGYYWLVTLVPDLPKKAAGKIEAIVPTLKNEKLIDEIIPYLEQLKAK